LICKLPLLALYAAFLYLPWFMALKQEHFKANSAYKTVKSPHFPALWCEHARKTKTRLARAFVCSGAASFNE
jgi:hypothetical protein